MMTGDCGDDKHIGYQVFEEIASTSSGQVYHINKTDVEEVCMSRCPSSSGLKHLGLSLVLFQL